MSTIVDEHMVKIDQKEITINAFDRPLKTGRFLGEARGTHPGTCVIFLAGIHGNEPSGIYAFKKFFEEFSRLGLTQKLKGSFYGIAGNLAALAAGKRYIEYDLNRIWTREQIIELQTNITNGSELPPDIVQQRELYQIISHLLQTKSAPFLFVDLHTTSGPTLPFVTINDTIENRKLAGFYPIPTVLGIEEYLEGTIMDYINDLGWPSIGLEAGQHDDPESVDLHVASIWITLVSAGMLEKEMVPQYDAFMKLLRTKAGEEKDSIYEVIHRKEVTPEEQFKMKPGYGNFDPIRKGELLAENKEGPIYSIDGGRIFMPLYQSQGSEGFFIIRKVSPFWLHLSKYLRHYRTDKVLTRLPGVKFCENRPNVLKVNRNIARFFNADIMHLLGYRRVHRDGPIVYFTKREIKPGNIPFYLRNHHN